MSIPISGTPARPSFLMANAAAAAGSASTYFGPIRTSGYDEMFLEVITDTASGTFHVPMSAKDTAPATPPSVRNYRAASNVAYTSITVASGLIGESYMFDITGAQWVWVRYINGSGSVATVTIQATLARAVGMGG